MGGVSDPYSTQPVSAPEQPPGTDEVGPQAQDGVEDVTEEEEEYTDLSDGEHEQLVEYEKKEIK
mgnify:CR=1 FL=1